MKVAVKSRGSTLCRVVCTWVMAWSDRPRAMDLFVEALQSEVSDIQQDSTAEGVALGAMAGPVDLVQRVSTGTEVRVLLTPALGAVLVMGSRSGDLDPGLVCYLTRTEQMSATHIQGMVNHGSGLLGVSEIRSDLRELLAREAHDEHGAEAVVLFCYQAKTWIGSFAAALGGLDTLVFAGAIGDHASLVRARICEGLGHLGVELDEPRDSENESLPSVAGRPVTVRVIRTNEELTIARSVCRVLGPGVASKEN